MRDYYKLLLLVWILFLIATGEILLLVELEKTADKITELETALAIERGLTSQLISDDQLRDERISELEKSDKTLINRLNYQISELTTLRADTNIRFKDVIREVNSFETAVENLTPSQIKLPTTWRGSKLTKSSGVNYGASGRETYYNLDMSGVVATMRRLGYSESSYPYWIREDGCKMLGNYIIVAANLRIRPRGTILETSLGWAIVCDTGGFVKQYPYGLDIATNW